MVRVAAGPGYGEKEADVDRVFGLLHSKSAVNKLSQTGQPMARPSADVFQSLIISCPSYGEFDDQTRLRLSGCDDHV